MKEQFDSGKETNFITHEYKHKGLFFFFSFTSIGDRRVKLHEKNCRRQKKIVNERCIGGFYDIRVEIINAVNLISFWNRRNACEHYCERSFTEQGAERVWS